MANTMGPRSIATVTLFLLLASQHVARAQLIERTDDGALQFSEKIVGKWNTEEKISMGIKIPTNTNEPSVFATKTWTRQGINGDSVLELLDVNESSDPLEVTFARVGHKDHSIAAFMRLKDDKLSIVFGSGFEYPIALPKSMEPGPDTVVLNFKRSVKDESEKENERLPLAVRLFDGANILADVTIEPFLGGKLRYSSEPLGSRAEQDYSPKTGIVIVGNVVPTPDGNRVVSLIIEIGSKQYSDDPKTTIARSEKLQLTTVVTPGKPTLIDCGEDRMCELTIELK